MFGLIVRLTKLRPTRASRMISTPPAAVFRFGFACSWGSVGDTPGKHAYCAPPDANHAGQFCHQKIRPAHRADRAATPKAPTFASDSRDPPEKRRDVLFDGGGLITGDMRGRQGMSEECRRLRGRAGDEALSGRLAVRGSRAAIRGAALLRAFQGRRLMPRIISLQYRARDRRIENIARAIGASRLKRHSELQGPLRLQPDQDRMR